MTFPVLFVLMSFAAYRLTRLAVEDTIIENQRVWLVTKLMNCKQSWRKVCRDKLAYLITCPYCTSAYVAAGVVIVTDQFESVPLPWLTWAAAWGAVAAAWGVFEK